MNRMSDVGQLYRGRSTGRPIRSIPLVKSDHNQPEKGTSMRSILSAAAVLALSPVAVSVAGPGAGATPPQRYTVTIVGGFPDAHVSSRPQALSDSGTVVGYSALGAAGTAPFSWSTGNLVSLGMPAGFDRAFANSVGATGTIVGGARTSDGSSSKALRWTNGTMFELGGLGGDHAAALGINDLGRIVGYASLPGNAVHRAVFWRGSTATPLLAPTWAGQTIAYDINASGQIVGLASSSTFTRPMTWLGGLAIPLPLPAGVQVGTAVAINGPGEIVGAYALDSTGLRYAPVIWRAGQLVHMGSLGSSEYALPAGINDAGHVVGSARAGSQMTGFLWQDGAMHDLRTLLTTPFAGVQITGANAINASGQIAATALIGGSETAVLLTPVPTPGGLALLAVAGVVAARRRRGR
jgi:MYXO-CTERM domain-containing protein